MRIAVLMTVHNRKHETLACLKGLFHVNVPETYSIEVYLTNDGCTDGTAEEILLLYPSVHILNGSGDLYWNRGMYTAWKEAALKDFDYYLWLNDDTLLLESSIKILLSNAVELNNQAIIVGATSDSKGVFSYGGRLIDGSAVVPNNIMAKVDLMNGNIVLIPRFAYAKIGIMDPYYRHDKGDSDYSLMAKANGILIYQAPVFLGNCERHVCIPNWMNSKIRIDKRFKHFHSILGVMPIEVFYYEKKHFGILRAMKKVLFMYLCCVWPSITILLGKEKELYSLKFK